jgi:hypothetical protein
VAGRGFPPQPTKRRLNKDPIEKRTLEVDDEVRGSALPADVLPQGEDWHPRTVAWWNTWRRSAQAQEFTATDWDFLLDTALMHHTMWAKARWEFAAELRLRAAKFGATPEDRMRLRLTVQTPGDQSKEQAPGSSEVASRRRNLHIAG